MSFNNLDVISPTDKLCPSSSAPGSNTYKATSTIGKQPTSYNRQQLMAIKNMVKLDTRYSKIPFQTINLVRKLKINKWSSKLDLQHQPITQSKINTKNLVNINITSKDHTITNNLRIATITTRSIKNKVELVLENSELESIDILAITETWLTDSQEDQAWVQTSGLLDQDYSFHTCNRIGRRGGGLGLQHRKEYQARRIDHDNNYTTLEQAGWSLQIGDRTITILVIYHPPGNTHTRLLDEVSQLVQYYMTNHKNLVILGQHSSSGSQQPRQPSIL